MLIVPAIDIRKGKCVMLTQGKLEQETIYSNDPVFMAKLWKNKGAKRLHIVDLDGAFCGVSQNIEIVKKIRESVDMTIQFGGGVRSLETVNQLIKIGIDRVIVGTLLVYHPEVVRKAIEKHKDRIMAALDMNNGKIAIAGWKELTETKPIELIKRIESMKINEMVVTDISKDGTLVGPNIKGIKEVAKASKIEIFASGGVGSIKHIKELKKLQPHGVVGVIVGKALYNESIKFEETLNLP